MAHAPENSPELRQYRPEAPGPALGIDEELIKRLVDAFYEKVRADPALAPLFDAAIPADKWPIHLAKMYDFWSSVALMSGRYKGKPVQVHAVLPGIGDAHFARWLDLFRQTAHETCPPQAAAFFMDRALRIAQSLRLGIAFQQGKNTLSVPPVEALINQRDEGRRP